METVTTKAPSLVRKTSLYRNVRTKQANVADTQSPPINTNTALVLHPLRPSQIKASQKITGNNKTIAVKRSESNRLPRHSSMEASANLSVKSDLLRTATHNSQRLSKMEKQALVQRFSTVKINSTLSIGGVKSAPVKLTAQERKSAPPLTAAEKRQAMMRPTNSVSTASRPALIKTGSTSSSNDNKPRWI